MALRYWVGGTAAWDGTAGTKWALTSGGAGGQAVPTSADDVFFTNLSTGTCTISTGNTGAKSITCTGFVGTLAGTAAISISGSVTLATGMTITYTGILSIIATATFTSVGKTFTGNITINGSGITVTLGDALTMTNRTLTLTQGIFTTSNFAVAMSTFSSSNTNTRTINLGSSTVTLSSDFLLTGTNCTVNAGTSTILFTSQTTFQGAGKTWNNISFTGNAVNNTVSGANTINTFSITAPSTDQIGTVNFDATQTITTMICSGATVTRRIMLRSNILGTARTLTVTTWTTVSDVDFRDITLTNTKSPTRGGDCGGNTNITFPAAKTVYWNLTGTRGWEATAWAASSGGTPAINNFPLAQDTAVFDNAGVVGIVQLYYSYNICNVNMSSRTSAMTFDLQANVNVYGNWSNGSGVTLNGSLYVMFFTGRSTQIITSNSKIFPWGIRVNSVASTVQLADALTTSYDGPSQLLSGILNLNGFTFTVSSALSTFTSPNTFTPLTRNITFNGGTLLIAGTDFNYTSTNFTTTAGTGVGTISLTLATAKIFGGSGGIFNCTLNQGGAGVLSITGANTFLNISNTYSATGATTITLSSNQILSDFTATGTVGKVLTLNSSVAGTARTLTKTSGTVAVNYLSIQDSTATGGAAWYAGANSTNVSNNTGWIFTNVPSAGGGGNFLMLFM